MLVRSDGLLIGQPAHAWVSGQLARAWGNEAFPPPVPREPFCLAAEQHDVGWADADLEPIAGADGRPLSFARIPRPAHVAIWRGAARRMLAQSRYAALLVSLHGTSLYSRTDADAEPPDVRAAILDYRGAERELQARLSAGLDPGEVDRNRRLLLALDRLSLALCHEWDTTLEDVPAASGPATIGVAPAGEGTAAPPDPGLRDDRAVPPDAAVPDDRAAPPDAALRDDRAVPPDAAVPDDRAAPPGAGVRDDRAVPPDAATVRFALDPWPFGAGLVVVGCEARRLDGLRDDLGAALAAAPWVPLRFELSPG